MQIDLMKYLRADEQLSQLLGSHNERPLVDFVTRPVGSKALPALVMNSIIPPHNISQDGQDELQSTRMQLSFFSKTYAEGRKAFDRVEAMLTPKSADFVKITGESCIIERVTFEGARDLDESDLDGVGAVFHLESDFIIWHRPLAS